MILSILVGVTLTVALVLADEPLQRGRCKYRGASDTVEDRTWHWDYPVGAKLKGSNPVDLDGDGQQEQVDVVAEIQRDYAVNLVTGQRSDQPCCWFRTRLRIRTPQHRLLYQDEWSIEYEDMSSLLETHGASSPEDYFGRFGLHRGYFKSGAKVASASDVKIRPEAIKWSLSAQGIKGVEVTTIAGEHSRMKKFRVFIYRAQWREDLRIVAYVPSLGKGVAIQVGY